MLPTTGDRKDEKEIDQSFSQKHTRWMPSSMGLLQVKGHPVKSGRVASGSKGSA